MSAPYTNVARVGELCATARGGRVKETRRRRALDRCHPFQLAPFDRVISPDRRGRMGVYA